MEVAEHEIWRNYHNFTSDDDNWWKSFIIRLFDLDQNCLISLKLNFRLRQRSKLKILLVFQQLKSLARLARILWNLGKITGTLLTGKLLCVFISTSIWIPSKSTYGAENVLRNYSYEVMNLWRMRWVKVPFGIMHVIKMLLNVYKGDMNVLLRTKPNIRLPRKASCIFLLLRIVILSWFVNRKHAHECDDATKQKPVLLFIIIMLSYPIQQALHF